MLDWVIGGLVYVPAFLFAKHIAADYIDPVLAGWLACGLTMGLRYEGPGWIRWERPSRD